LVPLRIEFSAPKLIFGNNFDEVTENDFGRIITTLLEKLSFMGISINRAILEQAPVSAIHYCKNIPLLDGSTPYHFINKMRQANISFWIDVNQTDFRNDGYSYKWHCNSYEVSFYDKIHDLEASRKSEKRALESENVLQLNLFEQFEKRKQFEVLRMEVRLNKRQKMKQLFQALGIETDLTFKSLFSQKISQTVLLYYLDTLESQRPKLLDYKPKTTKELFADLIINNPHLKPKQILSLFGLKMVLDQINPRELRSMLGRYKPRNWYRLMAEVKAVKLPATPSPFHVIREHLIRFTQLRLIDYKDRMLNNDKHN